MDDSVGGNVLRFDNFVLDKQSRTLRRGEKLISLRPKSFDVLVYLATYPGSPVSKLDIVDAVWPDVVVSDDSLTRCISDVRHAIGDSDHRIIKTLPRHGYQFSVAVDRAPLESPLVGRAAIETDRANGSANIHCSANTHASSRSLHWSISGFAFVAIVLFLALFYAAGWLRDTSVNRISNEPSVAVLPFANLSTDLSQAYFTEGITDDISVGLSRFGSIIVIARNSCFNDAVDSADVLGSGQSLSAHYLVTGSVRREAGRLRVSAALVDTESGRQLWAENFDDDVTAVFDIQDRIVANIVTLLVAHISHAEVEHNLRTSPRSLEAYDYYLRGIATMREMRKENRGATLETARRLYEQALSIDSRYPLALQALADTYLLAWLEPSEDQPAGAEFQQQSTLDRAQSLAQDAVKLDATHAEAQATLGWILYWQRDLDAALTAFDRALQINPNLVDGRYAVMLAHGGRAPDAIAYAEQIMRLDPFHPPNYPYYLGKGYFFVGRYEEAFNLIKPAAEKMPGNRPALVLLAAVAAHTNRLEQAEATAQKVLRIMPDFTISGWLDFLRIKDPAYVERLTSGLQLAGLSL